MPVDERTESLRLLIEHVEAHTDSNESGDDEHHRVRSDERQHRAERAKQPNQWSERRSNQGDPDHPRFLRAAQIIDPPGELRQPLSSLRQERDEDLTD